MDGPGPCAQTRILRVCHGMSLETHAISLPLDELLSHYYRWLKGAYDLETNYDMLVFAFVLSDLE